jgi:hypothetical protein
MPKTNRIVTQVGRRSMRDGQLEGNLSSGIDSQTRGIFRSGVALFCCVVAIPRPELSQKQLDCRGITNF